MEIKNLQRERESTNGGELERRKKKMKVVEGIVQYGSSPYLPIDVMLQVSTRLSIKALFKWKFLSKALWRAILDHPEFSDAYRRHNPRVLVISYHSGEKKNFRRFFHYCSIGDGESHEFVLKASLPSKSINERYFEATQVVVDGLVCLHNRNNVYLHHTFTGEIMGLPNPPNLLDFAPIDFNCSLGFDPINSEYKLFRMVRTPTDFRTFILKLGSNSSWRKLPKTDLANLLKIPTLLTDGFLVDGLLYWNISGNEILSFNLNKEEFILILAPILSLWFCHFAQLRGRLCIFTDSIDFGDADKLSLYMLYYKNNRKSRYRWTKIRISLPTGLQTPASIDFYRTVVPLGNLPTGEILLARLDVSGGTLIIYSYNDENNKFKIFTIGNFPDSVYSLSTIKDSCTRIDFVEPNFESLHSLIHRSSREITL